MKKQVTKILCGFAIIYFLTWLFFLIDGFIPTGGIDKADWLMFWGSFLAFAGTAFLGYVAYLQTKRADAINERLNKLQKSEYAPILKANSLIGLTKSGNSAFMQSPQNDIVISEMRTKDNGIELGYALPLYAENFDKEKSVYIHMYELHLTYFSKSLLNSITFNSVEFIGHNFGKSFTIGKTIDISLCDAEKLVVFICHMSNQNHLEDTEANRLLMSRKLTLNLILKTFSGETYNEAVTISKHFIEKGFKDFPEGKIECMVSSFTTLEEQDNG